MIQAKRKIKITSCSGSFSPSSVDVDRKLAKRRKSLSAIFGRIYSSEPKITSKLNKQTDRQTCKVTSFLQMDGNLIFQYKLPASY